MQNGGRGEGVRISFAFAVTCATWRLYPQCAQSIAYTSRHHGGVRTPPASLFMSSPSQCLSLSVANPTFSETCSLFVASLPSFPRSLPLFSRACSLFLQNTRGGGVAATFSAARHFATRHFPDGYNACSACSTLFVRAVGSIAGFTHRHG